MGGERRIYVDMDDVLCETARGFLALLNRMYGRSVAFEEIVSFDLSRSFDLGPAEIEEFMRLAHEEEVLADLDPIPEALASVTAWTREGYDIEVVTGRPPSTEPVSRRWLERFEVPFRRLTFLAKYSDLHSDEDRKRARPLADLEAGEFCLAIEDSRDMAEFLAGELGLPVALLDRPWNRNGAQPLPDGVVRCRGWEDVRAAFPQP